MDKGDLFETIGKGRFGVPFEPTRSGREAKLMDKFLSKTESMMQGHPNK